MWEISKFEFFYIFHPILKCILSTLASDITTQTPKVDDSGSNTCTDKVQCTEYGASVCTGYAGWAHDNCPKYCNFCTEGKTA